MVGAAAFFGVRRIQPVPWLTPYLQQHTFDVVDRITIDPNQCGGRPCIRGMRIRVKDVLDMLAEGATEQEILTDYPDLEAEDIRASLAYAARYFDHPVLVNS